MGLDMNRRIDPHLKRVLQTFSRNWEAKRAAAFQGLDFEDLREHLAEVRDEALDDLEGLLERFEANARRRGSVVLRAATGAEANALVRDILRDHGGRVLVKTKTMVSEETGLNRFLSKAGMRPRETDLGEWIVQLAGAAPTHMVMPAIHLTREGVARIFREALGQEVDPAIPALVQTARRELRREIFEARVGLTGANALIAENGSVMLVTNEGNGRLVTTVPPVHVVLASIDKVVGTMREALLLLKVLTRNATGQPISSYVSFLAGPHREKQYIILLDNHRRDALKDDRFREMLRCIKCSACLNVCPVYQVVGGERFAHVYMGGIGSLLTAWIHGLERSRPLADLCLVCHRCEEVCATKIGIADLVRSLRERLVSKRGAEVWKDAVFNRLMGRQDMFQTAARIGRFLRPGLARKDGSARPLPFPLKKYDRFRSLPAPARRSFTKLFERSSGREAPETKTKEVVLFTGCLVEHFYPEVGLAAVKVLRRMGYRVRPAPARCCGFPSANAGFGSAARKIFSELVPLLTGDSPVITLCPTCTIMLGRLGPELLGTDKAGRFGGRVIAFSQFLKTQRLKVLTRLKRSRPLQPSITYHDSCHHGFVLKAGGDSREILQTVLGIRIKEMDRPEACCGFAGSYAVSYPEVSEALLGDKLEAIKTTGADVVALDCPGCLLQIRGGCRKAGLKVEVRHTAELLAERLAG